MKKYFVIYKEWEEGEPLTESMPEWVNRCEEFSDKLDAFIRYQQKKISPVCKNVYVAEQLDIKQFMKKKPWWMKRYFSCSFCGFLLNEEDKYMSNKSFPCPKCKEILFMDDLTFDNFDKYSYKFDSSNE